MTKVEGADSLPLGQSTGTDGQLLQAYTYMYILYPRCEDILLAILCMGLPITVTISGQWLINSLKCSMRISNVLQLIDR